MKFYFIIDYFIIFITGQVWGPYMPYSLYVYEYPGFGQNWNKIWVLP